MAHPERRSGAAGSPSGLPGSTADVEVEDPPAPVVDCEPHVEQSEAERWGRRRGPSRRSRPGGFAGTSSSAADCPGSRLDLRQVLARSWRDSRGFRASRARPGSSEPSSAFSVAMRRMRCLGLFRDRSTSRPRGRDRAPVGAESGAPGAGGSRSPAVRLPGRSSSEAKCCDERDPEGAIQGQQPRPAVPPGVDRELLAKRHLDNGLVPAAPEQSVGALEERDPESEHRPHHRGHSGRDRCARGD